jgi:hypothetical protein
VLSNSAHSVEPSSRDELQRFVALSTTSCFAGVSVVPVPVEFSSSTAAALAGARFSATTSHLALDNGWAGIVINGYVRDTVALNALELGVKSMGTNPRLSRRDGTGAVGACGRTEEASTLSRETIAGRTWGLSRTQAPSPPGGPWRDLPALEERLAALVDAEFEAGEETTSNDCLWAAHSAERFWKGAATAYGHK